MTRGEQLQAIYDLGHRAVEESPRVHGIRDLFGPAVLPNGDADPHRSVLAALWDAAEIAALLESLRCGRCPACESGPLGVAARCYFAAADGVDAFKAGAHEAARAAEAMAR